MDHREDWWASCSEVAEGTVRVTNWKNVPEIEQSRANEAPVRPLLINGQ
jgi:hypothetical protein